MKSAFAVLLGILVFASPALSQQTKSAKDKDKAAPPGQQKVMEFQIPIPFAVLDVQVILRDAVAVKDIREQITKYGNKFEEEIEKERNAIRDANQELARQRTILSPEAFAEKRQQFEQRVVDVQKLVQQRQQELDRSRNDAMNKVNDVYMKIVSEIAAERNLALIVRKDQTVFSTPALDVTKELLARIDKQLPKVKVDEPGKDAAKGKVAKPGK
jgi:Skp family chaperone for outer membrane proteins